MGSHEEVFKGLRLSKVLEHKDLKVVLENWKETRPLVNPQLRVKKTTSISSPKPNPGVTGAQEKPSHFPGFMGNVRVFSGAA